MLGAGLPKKTKPPTLFSLCLGVVGKHLEDIIEDLGEIAINFPADTKVAPRTTLNLYFLLGFSLYFALLLNIYIEFGIYVLDMYEYEYKDIGNRFRYSFFGPSSLPGSKWRAFGFFWVVDACIHEEKSSFFCLLCLNEVLIDAFDICFSLLQRCVSKVLNQMCFSFSVICLCTPWEIFKVGSLIILDRMLFML